MACHNVDDSTCGRGDHSPHLKRCASAGLVVALRLSQERRRTHVLFQCVAKSPSTTFEATSGMFTCRSTGKCSSHYHPLSLTKISIPTSNESLQGWLRPMSSTPVKETTMSEATKPTFDKAFSLRHTFPSMISKHSCASSLLSTRNTSSEPALSSGFTTAFQGDGGFQSSRKDVTSSRLWESDCLAARTPQLLT